MYNERDEAGSFSASFTDDELLEQLSVDTSTKRAAEHFGVSARQIRKRIASIAKKRNIDVDPDAARELRLKQLIKSVPVEGPEGAEIAEIDAGMWGAGGFNKDREWEEHGLDKLNVRYKFRPKTPKFPLLQPAHPTVFAFDSAPRILRKIYKHVILSDAQIGRLWRDGMMVPTHDPHAMDIAEQIIAAEEPDELDQIGDWLDLAMLSRWPKKPEYVNTTQQGIQDGYDWWGRYIAAAGPRCKKKRKIKGNHDDRFQIFLRDHNLEAMGLRRASDTTGWPVFSTEFLLRYDELGIEVSEPFPNGVFWLSNDLVLMHAPPKKLEMAASVIHGHTHKITRETWAQTNHLGRVTYFRYDIGCLCKIDGSVPSDRPRTDWAQGIAVVEVIDGKIPVHNVELVHIQPERTLYRGQEFRSSLLPEAA